MNFKFLLKFFLLTLFVFQVQTQAATYTDHDYHKSVHSFDTLHIGDPLKCAAGVGICAQATWTDPADIDLHGRVPDGAGAYVGSDFDPRGGGDKGAQFIDVPDQHIGWKQRTVTYNNGQSKGSLTIDNFDGIHNSPDGLSNIEAIELTNPKTGEYRFGVHNYNNPASAGSSANVVVNIATDGTGFITSHGDPKASHYQEEVFLGAESDKSDEYIVNYVSNDGREGHAIGTSAKGLEFVPVGAQLIGDHKNVLAPTIPPVQTPQVVTVEPKVNKFAALSPNGVIAEKTGFYDPALNITATGYGQVGIGVDNGTPYKFNNPITDYEKKQELIESVKKKKKREQWYNSLDPIDQIIVDSGLPAWLNKDASETDVAKSIDVATTYIADNSIPVTEWLPDYGKGVWKGYNNSAVDIFVEAGNAFEVGARTLDRLPVDSWEVARDKAIKKAKPNKEKIRNFLSQKFKNPTERAGKEITPYVEIPLIALPTTSTGITATKIGVTTSKIAPRISASGYAAEKYEPFSFLEGKIAKHNEGFDFSLFGEKRVSNKNTAGAGSTSTQTETRLDTNPKTDPDIQKIIDDLAKQEKKKKQLHDKAMENQGGTDLGAWIIDDLANPLKSLAKKLYAKIEKKTTKKKDKKVSPEKKKSTTIVSKKNKPLKPEAKYLKGKKHGLKWKEGPATAKKTGIPQGQWGSKKDLEFAGEKASTLKASQGGWFNLPKGSTSVVHKPDGTTVKANRIWVRNNGSGTFHGYPAE